MKTFEDFSMKSYVYLFYFYNLPFIKTNMYKYYYNYVIKLIINIKFVVFLAFPQLYGHMISQRAKVIGGGGKDKSD